MYVSTLLLSATSSALQMWKHKKRTGHKNMQDSTTLHTAYRRHQTDNIGIHNCNLSFINTDWKNECQRWDGRTFFNSSVCCMQIMEWCIYDLTVRTPCQRPTSRLKSRTQTITSPAQHSRLRQCLPSLPSVFQPFCCSGIPHKHEDHSQNPMHWSISLATYARLKLQGVYRLISLAGQSPMEMTKQAKMTNYNMKFDCIITQQYCI